MEKGYKREEVFAQAKLLLSKDNKKDLYTRT